jgi:hypothetical protein
VSRGSPSPSLESVDAALVGVGLLLRKAANSRVVTIKEVVADGAAARQRADVRVGDRLSFVNGKSVEGLRLAQVLDLIKGPRGSRCTLTLLRERSGGGSDVFAVEVTRQWDGGTYASLQRTPSQHSWASSVPHSQLAFSSESLGVSC